MSSTFYKDKTMNQEEKLMHLFHLSNGPLSPSCTPEIAYDDEGDPIGVNVIKNGDVCWHESRESLVFDFVTRGLNHENPATGN